MNNFSSQQLELSDVLFGTDARRKIEPLLRVDPANENDSMEPLSVVDYHQILNYIHSELLFINGYEKPVFTPGYHSVTAVFTFDTPHTFGPARDAFTRLFDFLLKQSELRVAMQPLPGGLMQLSVINNGILVDEGDVPPGGTPMSLAA